MRAQRPELHRPMSGWSQVIFGCSGLRPTKEERALFRDVKPWGFILFARNVASADQVRALCTELRESVDDPDTLVFIDQEGGRVQRLRQPLARQRRPAREFGVLYQRDPDAGREAVRLNHRLMAQELTRLGINADCAPCLDVSHPETHAAIGDRALSNDPAAVAELGRAAIEGLRDGGVGAVIKHMPGHGRGAIDSHLALPMVTASLEELDESDFLPFRALADCPMGMTAHIVFEEIDPRAPATQSPAVIDELIRDSLGFDGLLMTDDLSMKALKGSFADRTRTALAAGCDLVLHCNGDMGEMKGVAAGVERLSERSLERAEAARAAVTAPQPFDAEAAEAKLQAWGLAGT